MKRNIFLQTILPALLLTLLAACRPLPDIPRLSQGQYGDLRSALGEGRKVLEIRERPDGIHILLEFSRKESIAEISDYSESALERVQDELRHSKVSNRPVAIWAHSAPDEDSKFRIYGHAFTESATSAIEWAPERNPDRDWQMPSRR